MPFRKKTNSVLDEAVLRATKLLNAAGVQYAILLADGTHIGTLPIGVTPARKGHHKEIAKATGWPEKLNDIKVGEVMFIEAPTKQLARKMVSSISAGAIYRFGTGNSLVSMTKRGTTWGVEVLVIEADPNAPKYAGGNHKAA
jgi:hypothetical protein